MIIYCCFSLQKLTFEMILSLKHLRFFYIYIFASLFMNRCIAYGRLFIAFSIRNFIERSSLSSYIACFANIPSGFVGGSYSSIRIASFAIISASSNLRCGKETILCTNLINLLILLTRAVVSVFFFRKLLRR